MDKEGIEKKIAKVGKRDLDVLAGAGWDRKTVLRLLALPPAKNPPRSDLCADARRP